MRHSSYRKLSSRVCSIKGRGSVLMEYPFGLLSAICVHCLVWIKQSLFNKHGRRVFCLLLRLNPCQKDEAKAAWSATHSVNRELHCCSLHLPPSPARSAMRPLQAQRAPTRSQQCRCSGRGEPNSRAVLRFTSAGWAPLLGNPCSLPLVVCKLGSAW